jgi:hypothetical protein
VGEDEIRLPLPVRWIPNDRHAHTMIHYPTSDVAGAQKSMDWWMVKMPIDWGLIFFFRWFRFSLRT